MIPKLLNYVRTDREEFSPNEWKRKIAAKLLRLCMDPKTIQNYHSLVSQHIEQEFTNGGITKAIVILIEFFVPETEEDNILFRKVSGRSSLTKKESVL